MLREYIVSEAMHALDIPTTRSLSVIATGRPVQRDVMLDGAVLARVAASHLRVGSFEYVSAAGDLDVLRRLADHAIARHYPAAAKADNPYLALLDAVVTAQAELVAKWMLIGFIHGVMNTDNMTISGETIDYGPCAFMDTFDPKTVFSSIDSWGRYAYGNQPAVAGWNLARLAEALLPLIADEQDAGIALATASLQDFPRRYGAARTAQMRDKLGLSNEVDDEIVGQLADELMELLERERIDYTSFFRRLSRAARGDAGSAFDAWAARWRALEPDADVMDRVNPVYIPRNHLVEEALAAATAGDLGPLEKLLAAVTSPYAERTGFERYAEPAPEEFGCYQTFCGT
jgi:serine/tyrosine/threonine adenylyltransferase